MPEPRLTIFARYPQAGQVKTRLIPALGPQGAARVYARLLGDTLDCARQSGLAVELRITGGAPVAFSWLFGGGIAIAEQGDGDLGERLARVAAPAIVIGSDAPGLTPALLRQARDLLAECEVVIGPASDGGDYLIGFSRPIAFAFAGIAWSTPTVLSETLDRLGEHGIEPSFLPVLGDIDTPEDLANWPDLLA